MNNIKRIEAISTAIDLLNESGYLGGDIIEGLKEIRLFFENPKWSSPQASPATAPRSILYCFRIRGHVTPKTKAAAVDAARVAPSLVFFNEYEDQSEIKIRSYKNLLDMEPGTMIRYTDGDGNYFGIIQRKPNGEFSFDAY